MLAKKNKYDLVIIGAGLSGSAAAAQAGQSGIDTLLIEKGHNTGGTGNYVEGVFAVGSELQKQRGVNISQEYILNEERNWTHALADMAVWRNYVVQAADNIKWMESIGIKINKMRTLGTGDDTWHLFDGHGAHAIHDGFLPTAKKAGVEIITSSRAIELTTNNLGEIHGVIIKDLDSNKKQFIETKNVIIATGGYLNNQKMLNSNNSHNGERIIPVNSGKNNGDGLKLAWSIGAKEFGMGTVMMFGGQVYDESVPGYKNWMRQSNRAATHEAGLWVNENGERFANEDCTDIWAIAGNTLIRQEKAYAIFDQKQLIDLTKHSFKGDFNYDHLIQDINDDLKNKKNYLTKADTVDELAKKLNLPNLKNTIIRYNELANKNDDIDFFKNPNLLHVIEEGPFYAFELGVGAFCTMGGLRTNVKNQVLNDNGEIIPGLFAIGADGSSSLVGDTYGVNVPGSEAGYCVYSGRNAVFNLVR